MRTGWSKREGEEKWKGQGLGREEKRGQEVGGEMDRSKTGGGSPCHHCLGYIIITMTIVRLFTYRQYVIYMYRSYVVQCWCVKSSEFAVGSCAL